MSETKELPWKERETCIAEHVDSHVMMVSEHQFKKMERLGYFSEGPQYRIKEEGGRYTIEIANPGGGWVRVDINGDRYSSGGAALLGSWHDPYSVQELVTKWLATKRDTRVPDQANGPVYYYPPFTNTI